MTERYGIIYKVTNEINEKVYIGQTIVPLNERISAHISRSLNKKDNMHFHRAIRKYGKVNFRWEVIARCDSKEELDKAEIAMIKKYNSRKEGYNSTRGGEGGSDPGFKHTRETKKKIAESLRGEENPNYGKHRSEETKRKISEANAKRYIVITPEGEEIFVYGIAKFCRNYMREKLQYRNLIKVAQGKRKQYKGYKCYYYNDN